MSTLSDGKYQITGEGDPIDIEIKDGGVIAVPPFHGMSTRELQASVAKERSRLALRGVPAESLPDLVPAEKLESPEPEEDELEDELGEDLPEPAPQDSYSLMNVPEVGVKARIYSDLMNVPEVGVKARIYSDSEGFRVAFSKPYALDPIWADLVEEFGSEALWDGLDTILVPLDESLPTAEQAFNLWKALVGGCHKLKNL
jgi:hypothetical protein